MDNYHPLSILPVASKILERVVQKQLIDYLEVTNQLSHTSLASENTIRRKMP